jgi:3' exoribonuclease, RNase T-like
MKYDHMMIDLETLGTSTNAMVVTVAAVVFNVDPAGIEFGPGIDMSVDIERAAKDGAVINVDTVTWWLTQSEEAREALVAKLVKGDLETAVLHELSLLYAEYTHPLTQVWSLPAAFDLRLLREMAARHDMALPWPHWQERCLRTAAAMHPRGKELRVKPELAHDAMSDAVAQARWLGRLMVGRGV